jgi:NAD(P)-dependent dehydrogenase (short-subunit alcohol dehydrogenase family)
MRMSLTSRLVGRTVIVTGGASGIGAACARRYAAEGAHVVIGDLNLSQAQAVARDIDGLAVTCDHTDPAQCAALVEAAVTRFGSVDALHNNAGIGWTGSFESLSADEARRVLNVLVVGPCA